MRTESLLLVALSMILSCSNVTESAQTQGTTGGGASDNVGGSSGNGAGGTTASRVSEAPSNRGGSTDKDAGNGGTKSVESSASSDSKTNSGGTSNAGGTKNVDGSDAGGSSEGGSSDAGGKESAGGTKSDTGAKSSNSAGGTKSTAKTKSTGGTKNAGGSPSDGGSSSSSGGSTSTAAVGCDRAGLDAAVKAYLAAIEEKDSSKMPLASSAKYTEVATTKKGATSSFTTGLWTTALPVKFSRSLLDVTGCETFTEVFITEGSHPYVLGTRLAVKDGEITEVYTIVTDDGDWLFDAKAYEACSAIEDWSVLPEASQSTREELIAAGQAYFDIFSDKSTVVPWGNPCFRLEGGKGCTPAMAKASTSCNVGIPDGITFKNTHWVVDVDLGAVVGITLFAGANPDTHMFRLIDGKIRYVHTLTVME